MADLEFEIFRAGTPASKGITASDIASVAAGYDPERNPGPVVMGHPEPGHDHSAPAFGAVSALRADGNKLFGTVKNLAQEVVDGVKQSRILNRSVGFWHPAHPSNPTPGKLSFRHLGLLGGSPPAIPGMEPLRFGASDQLETPGAPEEAIIFAAPSEPSVSDVLANPELMDGIAAAVAAKLKPEAPKNKELSAMTEEEIKAAQDQMAADEKALEEREAAIAAKETQFAADEEARAKAAQETRETENTKFAADLVDAGKFPPGHKDDLATILNALPVETLQFSGDNKTDPASALKAILNGADAVINFSAVSPSGPGPSANGDDEEKKALAAADAKTQSAYKA